MADDWELREIIPGLCSRETDGPTTMLCSLQGGGANSYVIGRRAYISGREINVEQFSQELRGSAGDDGLIWRQYLLCVILCAVV